MLNESWFPYWSYFTPSELSPLVRPKRTHLAFGAALFLVTVPVFFEAPLVRLFPWISLIASLGWFALSWRLLWRSHEQLWGDILMGFSWSWLAGSIYWGWLRWEPYLHLPVEAIGLPFALWCAWRGCWRVGNWFYLGSLFGTAITDLYFYLVGLIPHWRQLMVVEPQQVFPILQNAIVRVRTPWGMGCALVLIAVLVVVGTLPLRSPRSHWWAFGGAVLSTLLVDGLALIIGTMGISPV